MSNRNGSIPIIGQPNVLGATMLAAAKCPCGVVLTLIAQLGETGWQGQQAICSGCGTPCAIHTVTANATGYPVFNLAVGVRPAASATPAA